MCQRRSHHRKGGTFAEPSDFKDLPCLPRIGDFSQMVRQFVRSIQSGFAVARNKNLDCSLPRNFHPAPILKFGWKSGLSMRFFTNATDRLRNSREFLILQNQMKQQKCICCLQFSTIFLWFHGFDVFHQSRFRIERPTSKVAPKTSPFQLIVSWCPHIQPAKHWLKWLSRFKSRSEFEFPCALEGWSLSFGAHPWHCWMFFVSRRHKT